MLPGQGDIWLSLFGVVLWQGFITNLGIGSGEFTNQFDKLHDSKFNRVPHLVLAMIIEKKRLSATFSFVVAGSRTYAIDVAAVFLRLGVDCRISVYFRGGCLEYFGLDPFCQAKHVDSAVNIYFGGLNGVVLIVDGGCRACQVINFVHFNIKRERDVVAQEFEKRIVQKSGYVSFGARIKIVRTKHIVSLCQQALAKVRANKTSTPGNKNAFLITRYERIISPIQF
jgi:hypothetical protein